MSSTVSTLTTASRMRDRMNRNIESPEIKNQKKSKEINKNDSGKTPLNIRDIKEKRFNRH